LASIAAFYDVRYVFWSLPCITERSRSDFSPIGSFCGLKSLSIGLILMVLWLGVSHVNFIDRISCVIDIVGRSHILSPWQPSRACGPDGLLSWGPAPRPPLSRFARRAISVLAEHPGPKDVVVSHRASWGPASRPPLSRFARRAVSVLTEHPGPTW
jgi:hypothetical protein